MFIRILVVVLTVNAVASQLLLRRALGDIGSPRSLGGMVPFLASAAQSPWVYGSLILQVLGYVLWMILISRMKLGVATASVGAAFYVLMAFFAWLIYGETLSPIQWIGIVFVTAGVVCISLGQT
jgi:drug/metabolite transporter (DMT)-like permease